MTKTKKKHAARPKMADLADKYALYRMAVQDPDHEVEQFVRFYKDQFGRLPTRLREDFCAAAAVCCEWVKLGREYSAVGVDLDPEPLGYCRRTYLPKLSATQQLRVALLQQDVRTCDVTADIIAAQNYSFFLFKTRAALLEYFRQAHACLADEGIFILDMMGGGAMHDEEISESRQVARPTPEDKQQPPFRYVWEEASFNPVTHDVLFHIHFRFPDGSALDKAFTYDWRLWTIPEVRELLSEAGFSASHVYWETEDKDGEPSGKYRRTERGRPDQAWLSYLIGVK
ncbi:MAG: class I SAM-dependent methyltransferase [Deltaproteobacteria bacterium]|nr:class I SAM-dependent methyltransferase [Deltaproteobacteria bacterium]